MTRPHERWPELWTFFMLLHQDWDLDYPDEEAAMADDLPGWTGDVLQEALTQWHDAFDGATDQQVADIVAALNPSYGPERRFGSARGWADWIRKHLETELARRGSGPVSG
jgi:ribosomal protein S18 acetylase RimI-like enzyme